MNFYTRRSDIWKIARIPLFGAFIISGYCSIATALTRNGDYADPIFGSYGIFRKLSIVLSFPGVVMARFLGLGGGDYLSNRDIFNLLWLNFIAYGLCIFLVILGYNLWKNLASDGHSVRRRRFLTGAVVGLGTLGGATFLRKDVDTVEVVNQTLKLPKLDSRMRGWKLALMADWHRGPFVEKAYLRRVVELCNEQKPDLVCIVGDFIYSDPKYYSDIAQLLGELRPRLALFGTLGNHDHWQGADTARKYFAPVGMHLVDNSRLYISPEGNIGTEPFTGSLCMAGLGDMWEDKVDFKSALEGVPEDIPRILLAHNPDCAEDKSGGKYRVDVLLAGHTHGGQISLPALGTILVPTNYGDKYVAGWQQGPNFPVYTNRGIGMTVLPFRSGARPEITIFTLE